MQQSAPSVKHSGGRAFLYRGDVYYSPNCARQVDVPEYLESPQYPFHGSDARFHRFLTPRYWTRPYHYLAFIPLRPSFEGDVFGVLRESVANIIPINNQYGLAEKKMDQWQNLENALLMMAHLLGKHYFTTIRAALRPPLPSMLGFTKTFSQARIARINITASRDWFLMWMSLISSKIADVNAMSSDELKDWFSILADNGIPQPWLSSVQTSFICNFSPMHPRVGTFIDIYRPLPHQPTVEWFLKSNIPVWYRWDSQNSQHNLDYLAPPPHVWQEATTFMCKRPDYSSKEYEDAQKAYLASKPWEDFFATREERNTKSIAKETPEVRTTRLNRERHPPTVSCEVYEWEWSEDGSIQLVRTAVPKKLRQETLALYSASQKRYDAVRNVWDVCEYFGEDDAISDGDDNDDNNGDPFEDAGFSLRSHDLDKVIETRIKEVQQRNSECYSMQNNRVSQGPEINLLHSIGSTDVTQYLHLHYGYLHPIPIPPTESQPIQFTTWAESLKCIGLTTKNNPPIVGLANHICEFIGELREGNPQDANWDLSRNNHLPISDNVLKASFRTLPNGHFLLSLTSLLSDVQCEWQIALTTPANLLYIIRYFNFINTANPPLIHDLAQHLAEHGIPFRTYLKLDRIPSTLSISAIVAPIPRRDANYKFTPADFETYLSDRRRLLSTPRARAAILRGGIVGRLARECIEIEDVLSGPSSAVRSYRLGDSVDVADMTYWDDGLSQNETDIICGMFYCHTGQNDQISKLSWWPLPEYWDQAFNSYNWGHWTEWNEHWYQERLLKIQEGTALPLTHTEWRTNLRSAPAWRKVIKFISQSSAERCVVVASA